MENHGSSEFGFEVPILLLGVAHCEGLACATWNTKAVTLTNEFGEDVARGICHSVDVDLRIDMDGRPLNEDRVAIKIAESLCEAEVPSLWMWSMRSWHIS